MSFRSPFTEEQVHKAEQLQGILISIILFSDLPEMDLDFIAKD